MKPCMILIYFIMMVIMGYSSKKDENKNKGEWEVKEKISLRSTMEKLISGDRDSMRYECAERCESVENQAHQMEWFHNLAETDKKKSY